MSKFIQILKDINELIVFKHSVFALPFIFMAMIVSSKLVNGTMWFGLSLLFLGILCAVSARNYAMALNRYLDEDIDRPNPRCASRPSVDGRIGRKNLLLFIIANAVIFVVTAYFINSLAYSFVEQFSVHTETNQNTVIFFTWLSYVRVDLGKFAAGYIIKF